MKLTRGGVIVLGLAAAGAGLAACRRERPAAREEEAGQPSRDQASPARDVKDVVLACSGRVEGLQEAVGVGAGMDGVIAEIKVKEGQQVQAGAILARIARADLDGELKEAQSGLERARALRRRLLRGSRAEERARAEAERAAAAAAADQARARHVRLQQLYEQGIVAADARDEGRRDVLVAEATLEASRRSEALVKAEPLPEEITRAAAEVSGAQGRVRRVSEQIRMCEVRAPFAGTVLRTNMRAGEAYSTVNPQPVVTIADTSRFRVRAEVDERDLSRVRRGQLVVASADGLGEPRVAGVVSEIGAQMGRRRVRSGDPAEKSDRDVLEVLIDLDETDHPLVVGLRVTVQFLGDDARASARLSNPIP